ncbi:hypothetical protein [Microbacterium sp. ZW T5_56]|uniref:hypothetical protein n=1 Tax=Microbacterium sp. ZW T5_56 TaxID=3378081 RepID=UPI003851DD06
MSEYAVCSRCSVAVPVTVEDYLEVLAAWLIRFANGRIVELLCDVCKDEPAEPHPLLRGGGA